MYIVFEGIVGSGKSTQSKKLVEFLTEKYGVGKVIHVREPGSTPIAEDIRYLAQGKEWENEEMHPLTNAYLYAAARAQTLHTLVKPALELGKIVVSDRSFLSSLAYQGEAQGLGFDTILSVNRYAIEGILPDKIFYMDIDVETALSRTFDAAGDKWEKLGKSFFESIVQGYDKCEKLDILKNRFFRIDARRNMEDISLDIYSKIQL
ncbi:dTMP kinase [Candidatus Gracilibacteria bacterium]|nr:dTMP kinase [Candidatus Gracilibacteria bacterium]